MAGHNARKAKPQRSACHAHRLRETAFGIFYTATIGAGALSPVLYGFVGDAMGLSSTTLVIAAVVLATLPLTWRLSPMLGMGEEKP